MSKPDVDRAVLVHVGTRKVGVPLKDVHKIVLVPTLCSLPRLAGGFLGIAQHRGRVLTVFDGGTLLGGSASPKPTSTSRLLVLERPERQLAMVVDLVEGIEPIRGELHPDPSPLFRRFGAGGPEWQLLQTDVVVAAVLQTFGQPGASEFAPTGRSV